MAQVMGPVILHPFYHTITIIATKAELDMAPWPAIQVTT